MPEAVPGVDVDQTAARAAILAAALADTAAELRLIEPGDMIDYIRRARWAEIADLVQTASELTFADGSLGFACRGDFAVDWLQAPTISLDLEFAAAGVTAFLTLHLGRDEDRIELRSVFFAAPPPDEVAGTGLLAAAVAGARLVGCAARP